jgi:putative ABC transport system ATP-binding protein
MSAIIETHDLTKTFPVAGGGELTVLDSVDLLVHEGSTCAVVGPSGSGKTTLLGLCAGLDLPTRGEVALGGVELATLNEDERAALRNRLVGFVFQNFQLVPTLTALENVMVPLELRRERGATAEAAAKSLLAEVGLEERMSHFPVQLSGGEQQRVALARAFVHRPKVLFADEPTGNLDAESGAVIEEALFRLNAQQGTTLVIVTHDLDLADKTNLVFRMKGGRLVDTERHAIPS